MSIDRQSGTAAEPAFQLTPPEVMAPVHQDQAVELVTVKPERLSEIELQVESFLGVLMSADLHSQDFKDKLDQTFALGRQEVSVSAALLQSRPPTDAAGAAPAQ